MNFYDTLRSLMPAAALEKWRGWKKERVRRNLEKQRQTGRAITLHHLKEQLQNMGITEGDHLMVHCAMSKIGFLENGPQTLIKALLDVVGSSGTVCMPSSPVSQLQLDYARKNPVFNVKETPSAMGALSEEFRRYNGTLRSLHPTEPVCANGKLAEHFVSKHAQDLTPYAENSPWKKLMDAGGKIIYIGVTLDNAGTHLHTLEDAVDFKYPVYFSEVFEFRVVDENGNQRIIKSRVHNPEFSKQRKCDQLIPGFEEAAVLKHANLGNAKCLLLDAKAMLSAMVKNYKERGVTMYTPHGEKIKGYDD